jgi:phosphomannomutase
MMTAATALIIVGSLTLMLPSTTLAWVLNPSTLTQSTTTMKRNHQSLLVLATAKNNNNQQSTTTTKQSTTIDPSMTSFLSAESFALSECDNSNTPPSLGIILRSLQYLFQKNKSDLRGRYVSHPTHGTMLAVSHALKKHQAASGGKNNNDQPILTPFFAYCIGHAIGQLHQGVGQNKKVTLAIGRDPRPHGTALADAFARGATAAGLHVIDLGLATTPACAAYTIVHPGTIAVMVTASHLPRDRNGFKIFGMAYDLHALSEPAQLCATTWFNHGILPLYNEHAVMCHESDPSLDFYKSALRQAAMVSTTGSSSSSSLAGFKIVLNTGNGSGGFFAQVLQELGADVSGSIHLDPDGNFPNGIPNPEDPAMLQATIAAMTAANADLGIMLDTDADRCGFVVPTTTTSQAQRYTALNRNRLIALLGVVFSHEYPGCTIVTDSVTSEGLTTFLQDTLGLEHVRYLKGYANVIGKAKELTESGTCQAELAIETSGHCAMREHKYLDDGTYTAIKVSNLLARHGRNLLALIADLPEMSEVAELRMEVASLDALDHVFDCCQTMVDAYCAGGGDHTPWQVDRLNLEGIRVRLGDGQFFMLRKSLHDPIISLQIEAHSVEQAREHMVQPLHQLLRQVAQIKDYVTLDVLAEY